MKGKGRGTKVSFSFAFRPYSTSFPSTSKRERDQTHLRRKISLQEKLLSHLQARLSVYELQNRMLRTLWVAGGGKRGGWLLISSRFFLSERGRSMLVVEGVHERMKERERYGFVWVGVVVWERTR